MKLYIKTINAFLIFVMMISCLSAIQASASELDQNAFGPLLQEEIEIVNELYEIDPNFTYEGELVSVSKTTEILETQKEYIQNFDGVLTREAKVCLNL
ncbi:hypothetical protein [Tannockella kyphosi]|uniref:hypothetical protein n=1 Tax=Tannockella kyphosi TaxID=2899121 RepID=UPI002012CE19|nr:hypothetical protein [Tannockella kyphosi]